MCGIGQYTVTGFAYGLYLCVIIWTYLKLFITSFVIGVLWPFYRPAQNNDADVRSILKYLCL